jgi:hypothetical protein
VKCHNTHSLKAGEEAHDEAKATNSTAALNSTATMAMETTDKTHTTTWVPKGGLAPHAKERHHARKKRRVIFHMPTSVADPLPSKETDSIWAAALKKNHIKKHSKKKAASLPETAQKVVKGKKEAPKKPTMAKEYPAMTDKVAKHAKAVRVLAKPAKAKQSQPTMAKEYPAMTDKDTKPKAVRVLAKPTMAKEYPAMADKDAKAKPAAVAKKPTVAKKRLPSKETDSIWAAALKKGHVKKHSKEEVSHQKKAVATKKLAESASAATMLRLHTRYMHLEELNTKKFSKRREEEMAALAARFTKLAKRHNAKVKAKMMARRMITPPVAKAVHVGSKAKATSMIWGETQPGPVGESENEADDEAEFKAEDAGSKAATEAKLHHEQMLTGPKSPAMQREQLLTGPHFAH